MPLSKEPETKQEALARAKYHRTTANTRLRSMGVGGQAAHDHHMRQSWEWEKAAQTLPDEEGSSS